jgi:hypothetical protein
LYDELFGGRPLIYIRKTDQEPFLNFTEYNIKIKDLEAYLSLVMSGENSAFSNYIHVDDTKEGFFEYTVLQIMGGQFYLFWHALYDDTKIICDITGLDAVSKDFELSRAQPPDYADYEKARKLDFQPVIEFKDNIVIVTVMVFTKWGGFIKETFYIRRYYPHTIISKQEEVILEYNCGIWY